MKKSLFTALFALASLAASHALTLPLTWDPPNPFPTPGVLEYRIYESTQLVADPATFPVGWVLLGTTPDNVLRFNPTIDGLPHFYVCTCFTGILESGPSNMVGAPTRPPSPRNLILVIP